MRRPGRDVPPHRAGFDPRHVPYVARNYAGASANMVGIGDASTGTGVTAAELAATESNPTTLWNSPGGPALVGAVGLTVLGIFGSGAQSLGDHQAVASVLGWGGMIGGAVLAAVAQSQISTSTAQPASSGGSTAGIGRVQGSLGVDHSAADMGGYAARLPSASSAASSAGGGFYSRMRAQQGNGISWQLRGIGRPGLLTRRRRPNMP